MFNTKPKFSKEALFKEAERLEAAIEKKRRAPMTQTENYRQQRIERLLHDLKYEITRGIMEGEIDERLGFRFVVPISRILHGGVVACEFRTRPQQYSVAEFERDEPDGKLRVVK